MAMYHHTTMTIARHMVMIHHTAAPSLYKTYFLQTSHYSPTLADKVIFYFSLD